MNQPQPISPRGGFGLLELATSLAFLVILLGVTVSLARFVRAASADQMTRDLLRKLDELAIAHPDAVDPTDEVIVPPHPGASEADWAQYVEQSNRLIVRKRVGVDEPITDAWGNLVGYIASRSEIGFAPHDRAFFFSAGPDGRFLTRDDNLYSYEQLSATPAATAPAAGGHRE